ncbi:polymerase [Desulfitobacterium hafniense]|uniref:Polymerase n=1 Tax=Desulfitobacterium hafniense TaxID=49338 RepID=A0A0W1JPX4_DESHA|nr:O-antigen ligase family protein [Desulfitobacterium hafniense]KTE93817.1 polymerase [Desulfitobacterium hafniense]
MIQWTVLLLTLLALGLLIVKKPLWLIPLLGAAVALEISSTWYPDLGILEKVLGEVSLTRFTSISIVLAACLRVFFEVEIRARLMAFFKDPVTLLLLLYIAYGALSLVYSADMGNTVKEILRLLVLFAVFLSIALLLDQDSILLPFHGIHLAALALLPLALYEGISGNLIWQGENLLKEHTLRVNATFVDPNIYARFLILGIVANFVIQIFTHNRRIKLTYWACLPLLLVQLLLTGSRGGILTLGMVLVLALFFLPNKKNTLYFLGACALGAVVLLLIRPEIWERMLLFTQDLEVSSPQRLYLWQAGIAIFTDHPWLGTGLGSFQTVFLQDYIHLKNIPDGATLSHTTILTIASELGVLGLLVLTALWVAILGRLYTLYNLNRAHLSVFSETNEKYSVAAGYFLWAMTVFISSQGEGRFFEDPVLWLSCAGLVFLRLRQESYRYRVSE